MQLLTRWLWASNGFNDVGIAIEFAGYLKKQYDLDFVFLRQGSVPSPQINQKSNCPGPHIWYGDGGKSYKLADGDPIPDSWRKAPTT